MNLVCPRQITPPSAISVRASEHLGWTSDDLARSLRQGAFANTHPGDWVNVSRRELMSRFPVRQDAGVRDTATEIRIVPANKASWDELEAVLVGANCHG